MGESISVCAGKGFSDEESRVSAMCEAVERHAGEDRGRIPKIRANAKQLPNQSVQISRLCVSHWSQLNDDSEMEWCLGWRIADGAVTYVPACAVFFPYDGKLAFAPSTNGLAAGTCLEEAVLHGLLECVERDAQSLALAHVIQGRGARYAIVAAASCNPKTRDALDRIRMSGLAAVFRNITSDTGIPTVLCSIGEIMASGERWHYGSGCRLSIAAACEAALLEAVQSRLVDIQGAREDLPAMDIRRSPHPWFQGDNGDETAFHEDYSTNDLLTDVQFILERLSGVGVSAPVLVDLSLENIPLRVVRVVAPGLEFWAKDPSRVGARVRSCFP